MRRHDSLYILRSPSKMRGSYNWGCAPSSSDSWPLTASLLLQKSSRRRLETTPSPWWASELRSSQLRPLTAAPATTSLILRLLAALQWLPAPFQTTPVTSGSVTSASLPSTPKRSAVLPLLQLPSSPESSPPRRWQQQLPSSLHAVKKVTIRSSSARS